ncbi:MAG: glycosyltransferase [Nitrososphaerales archaeon]
MIMLKAFDRIIVESPRVVDSFKLTKFATKIRTSGSLFVDEKEFMPAKRLIDRELDLVFVGGLTSEKGIMIFADCIKRVCAIRPLKALIIGDGALRKPLETYLKKWQLESAVQLKYWVRYSDMPAELNRARMLLVPSMSEGVPNVILEAMACGTIVLASSAGGIRDVVVDGQTGFILESLDPSYIAKTVVGILDDTALMEKVTNRGRLFVESRFTLNAARNAWNYIFNQDDISNSTLKSA